MKSYILLLSLIAFSAVSGATELFKCGRIGSSDTYTLKQGAAGLDFVVRAKDGAMAPTDTTGLSCALTNEFNKVLECSQTGSKKTFKLLRGASGLDFMSYADGKIEKENNFTGLKDCVFNFDTQNSTGAGKGVLRAKGSFLKCGQGGSRRSFTLGLGAAGLDMIVREKDGQVLETTTTGLDCKFSNDPADVLKCSQQGSHRTFKLSHGAAGLDFFATTDGKIDKKNNFTGLTDCSFNFSPGESIPVGTKSSQAQH